MSELLYSPATYGLDLSAKDMIKPRARAAPMMAVLRNTLWMWGGTVEVGRRGGRVAQLLQAQSGVVVPAAGCRGSLGSGRLQLHTPGVTGC